MQGVAHSRVAAVLGGERKFVKRFQRKPLPSPRFLRHLLIALRVASLVVATPWAAPCFFKNLKSTYSANKNHATQANTLFASSDVLLSVESSTTLYSISCLFVIVQSLQSRSRHTGDFPFPQQYMPGVKAKTYQSWGIGEEGKNKQRGRRNAIYFPLCLFINLHLLSNNIQENHSFTRDRDAHYPSSKPMKNYSRKIIHD